MLPLSFLTTTIVLGILSSKSSAASSDANVQKLCQGQRFGAAVPNPHDCGSFYVCQFVVQLVDCPIGLQFDRRKKVCNWPKDAGCDWVEPDGPNTNDDNHPEVKPPNEPKPDEEQPKTSEEDNDNKPTEDKNPEDGQNSKESAEQSKPGDVTLDDFITEEPDYTKPTVDQNNSSEQDQNNQPNHPATDDDFITAEPQTPTPSAEESQDKQTDSPATDDDMITYTQPPIVDSGESVDPTPGWPKPDQPPSPPSPPSAASTPSSPSNSEETDQQSSEGNQDSIHSQNPPTPPNSEETDKHPSEGDQNSSETPSSTEDGDKPEHPKPPHPDLPTAGNQSSQHWNLIASIVSVETSHTGGFINHPTVGAHSPETGLPVDVMTGYNPKKVQCLHSGLYFLPHPTNCQKYFICAYSHLHLHSCGNGVIWNHKREQCDLGSNSKCYSRDADSEDNSSELVTPFLDDQTRKTTRKVVKPSTRKPVPTKLPVTVTTPVSTTISQKLPACPANRQIYLPNLDDCHKYFICIMGKPVLTSCPNGLHWDVIGEVCDKPSVARCGRRQKYNII